MPSYDGPGRPDREGQTAVHPVAPRHPQSGAEGRYLDSMFTTRVLDWSEAESPPLIEFLDCHMTRSAFACRLHRQPGQAVM